MKKYVALLRGINVGGNSVLPMKDLVAIMESIGASAIKTYIQSGNVVFRSAATSSMALRESIIAKIRQEKGLDVDVLVLTEEGFVKAIDDYPFPVDESSGSTQHFGFLGKVPSAPDWAKLDALKAASEQFRVVDSVFYLCAPDGIGRSKLAAGAEKALGVSMTLRNRNTVVKIRVLLASI